MGYPGGNGRSGAYRQAESTRAVAGVERPWRRMPVEDDWEEPVTGPVREIPGRHASYAHRQEVTVSVPTLRTFLVLAAVVAISVVLSVVATITLISIMNAGVILPQYDRYNQPTQVNQLGVCVAKNGQISTPQSVDFCANGAKFVHVQPNIAGG